MKTKSAKSKGRRLQNWVVKQFIDVWKVSPDDVRPALMGETGKDIKFHQRAGIPYSVECKNQEGFKNVYDAIDQARKNAGVGDFPLVFIKSNNKPPLVIMEAETWFKGID